MRDEVYNTLLNWIMEGVLRPGEKLLDKDLAEHMGVSRTPVREALRRLEDKGLVESAANRWTRVSEIRREEPDMIYPIIWSLEELAVTTAVGKLTDEDFEQMAAANADFADALARDDSVATSGADAAFHDVYIGRSENPLLIEILRDLKIRYRRMEVNYFGGYSYGVESVAEHDRIIEALKAGDGPGAIDAIRANWVRSLERFRTKSGQAAASEGAGDTREDGSGEDTPAS